VQEEEATSEDFLFAWCVEDVGVGCRRFDELSLLPHLALA